MKILLTSILAIMLVGCATPVQKEQIEAMKTMHKAERVMTVHQIKLNVMTDRVEISKKELESSKVVYDEAKANFMETIK